MNNFRTYMISFALIIVLMTLCKGIYNGLETNYDIVRDEGQSLNLFERILNMNLISGVNDFIKGVLGLFDANWLNPLDVLGSLAAAGIGIFKTIGGLVTLPVEIIGIVGNFYFIPDGIATFVGIIVAVTITIMILQAYIKPFHPL